MYHPMIVKKIVDDEHFYYVDDEYFPAVTTILSEAMPMPYALKQWLGDVGSERAEQKLMNAALRGTLIHDACSRLIQGDVVKLWQEFPKKSDQKCIVAFANFLASYQPRGIKSEQVIASKMYRYAGTLDIQCLINGEPWIIDIKTTGAIYDSHKLQLVAYQQAFKEMTDVEAKVGILHLNPRTKVGYAFHTDLEIQDKPVTIDDYMRVYEMYKMLNGGKIPEPPTVDEYPEFMQLS